MNLFLGVIGVLILCGALVIWFLYFRRIQEDAGLVELPKKKNPGTNDLEQFIAAYRSGQVTAADLKAEQPSPAPLPALQPAPQPVATAAPAAAQTAFLRPEVKVGYLSLRACLRDHHVFAHVRLADLGRGLASGRIDLLVCNSRFEPIAAIDVVRNEPEADAGKLTFLRNAGLRYLRLPAARMPKPDELRGLVLAEKP
ncbi:MAG TPA: hypothetical protein VMP00_14465 [Burkholderiales bacterium]|nr:hypothetical protein [Burkholderiales bacterium]